MVVLTTSRIVAVTNEAAAPTFHPEKYLRRVVLVRRVLLDSNFLLSMAEVGVEMLVNISSKS